MHQNSVKIFWGKMYRGQLFFRANIYRGRLLTLITESSSRLLRIRISADLTMYWFPVCHFRCMKFKPLVIWIWNQNIAISTIVGTSSHGKLHILEIPKFTDLHLSWLSSSHFPSLVRHLFCLVGFPVVIGAHLHCIFIV